MRRDRSCLDELIAVLQDLRRDLPNGVWLGDVFAEGQLARTLSRNSPPQRPEDAEAGQTVGIHLNVLRLLRDDRRPVSSVLCGGEFTAFMTDAVILSACRTPMVRLARVEKICPSAISARVVIRGAIARAQVEPDSSATSSWMRVQAGGRDECRRQAALKRAFPVDVPAETVNRVCGSGLQAVVHAAEAVAVDMPTRYVAGGMESMSNAPYLLKGARWGLGWPCRSQTRCWPRADVRDHSCHMGITAERSPRARDLARRAGPYAAESQRRAVTAVATGRLPPRSVPVQTWVITA